MYMNPGLTRFVDRPAASTCAKMGGEKGLVDTHLV